MHNVFMLYLKNNFVISIPGGNIPLERELDGLEHVILISDGDIPLESWMGWSMSY